MVVEREKDCSRVEGAHSDGVECDDGGSADKVEEAGMASCSTKSESLSWAAIALVMH